MGLQYKSVHNLLLSRWTTVSRNTTFSRECSNVNLMVGWTLFKLSTKDSNSLSSPSYSPIISSIKQNQNFIFGSLLNTCLYIYLSVHLIVLLTWIPCRPRKTVLVLHLIDYNPNIRSICNDMYRRCISEETQKIYVRIALYRLT